MALWLGFEGEGVCGFGTLDGDRVTEYQGDLFGEHSPSGRSFPLAQVRVRRPCTPTEMIGLWNNFGERALLEGLTRPAPPARPAFADHLGLDGAPTIFWGSREPGAGCPCPTRMASVP